MSNVWVKMAEADPDPGKDGYSETDDGLAQLEKLAGFSGSSGFQVQMLQLRALPCL